MEFDKSRIYTSANADELKVGSRIIVADCFGDLRDCVLNNEEPKILIEVLHEYSNYRFKAYSHNEDTEDTECFSNYAFAYLVPEPKEKKLKWTDLKIGDILCNETESRMVTGIDTTNETDVDGNIYHICLCDLWLTDKELEDWKKENDR